MNIRRANNGDLYWLMNAIESLARYVQDSSNDDSLNDVGLDHKKTFQPWFEEALSNPDSIVYIAEYDDHIAGFISGRLSKPFVNPIARGFIGQIGVCWVEPEYRERGCGRALVETIESWFDRRGVEFVDMYYLEGNLTAKQVWARFGYEAYRMSSRKKL